MRRPYLAALITGAVGLAAAAWGIAAGTGTPPAVILVAAGCAPAAVLLASWGRLGGRFPAAALIAGALLAPPLALAGHALAAGFTAAFVQGFADSGRQLIESLHADPRLTTALASPWVLFLLIEVAAVAPFTEEAAKAAAAVLGRPAGRADALLAGIAAGAGFAVTENVLYASMGWAFGSPWQVIALARSIGAAVHPLACGLVMLGWWEWRSGRRPSALLKGYLAGVGVHALWNGSLVVVGVIESVISVGGSVPSSFEPLSLTYDAALGTVAAALLAVAVTGVAAGRQPFRGFSLRDGRALAGWTLTGASLLLPVALIVVSFPSFYHG